MRIYSIFSYPKGLNNTLLFKKTSVILDCKGPNTVSQSIIISYFQKIKIDSIVYAHIFILFCNEQFVLLARIRSLTTYCAENFRLWRAAELGSIRDRYSNTWIKNDSLTKYAKEILKDSYSNTNIRIEFLSPNHAGAAWPLYKDL